MESTFRLRRSIIAAMLLALTLVLGRFFLIPIPWTHGNVNLCDAGVFINPVIPPACAPQDTLVRFALMATHTKEQVERGVQALKKIFKEQGIIK